MEYSYFYVSIQRQMRYLFAIGLTLSVMTGLSGQLIHEEPAITELMDKFIEHNFRNTEVRGWRIQVLSTTDRRLMESTQSRFKRIYPEYDLVFEHQEPYYLLKTGAFLTQQDARPMRKRLQDKFPGAIIVTDEFEISEVLDYQE